MEQIVIYLIMVQRLLNLKRKILKLLHMNCAEDWTVDYMKKTVIKGCVYDFSVDYDAIKVSDMLDIYKYLMENN